MTTSVLFSSTKIGQLTQIARLRTHDNPKYTIFYEYSALIYDVQYLQNKKLINTPFTFVQLNIFITEC